MSAGIPGLRKLAALVVVMAWAGSHATINSQAPRASDKMNYWSVQRRGANYGPKRLRREDLQAAAAAGIEFLRLRTESMPPSATDFLIGSADRYYGVNQADLRELRAILDEAGKYKLKIVLTMFSLPGARAKKDVSDPSDGRIWRDERY